jgi:hypothetical protein
MKIDIIATMETEVDGEICEKTITFRNVECSEEFFNDATIFIKDEAFKLEFKKSEEVCH